MGLKGIMTKIGVGGSMEAKDDGNGDENTRTLYC